MVMEVDSPMICYLFKLENQKRTGVIQPKPSVKAWESCNLLVWSPTWVRKPKNQEHQCPRAENSCLNSSKESELAFALHFCSVWAFTWWHGAGPRWSGSHALLSSLISLGKYSQIPPKIMWYQPYGHPLVQGKWQIKFTITKQCSQLIIFGN